MMPLLLAAVLATAASDHVPSRHAQEPACQQTACTSESCYSIHARFVLNVAPADAAPIYITREVALEDRVGSRDAALCLIRRIRREGLFVPLPELIVGADGNVVPEALLIVCEMCR